MSYNFKRKIDRQNKKTAISEWLKVNKVSKSYLTEICIFKYKKSGLASIYNTIIDIELNKYSAKEKEEITTNGEETSTD